MERIEIDWEIHQMIEAERRGFDEPPYLALRRLLRLPPPAPGERPEASPASGGAAWSEGGVTVPHGSLARMEYLRGTQIYEGRFLDGRLVVNGRSFDALSAAANALAVTRNGERTQLNGWRYWKVKFPGESKWRSLGDLRNARRQRD